MEILLMISAAVFLFFSGATPLHADTAAAPAAPPVIAQPDASSASVQDPRKLEGEIVNVDLPENQILVKDIDDREKRVQLKQGMIGNYKVGDYVKIYLMADMKEAKTIQTYHSADVEGDVTLVDYAKNLIVVRDNGSGEHSVLVRPDRLQSYKVGDHLRLYVVTDDPNSNQVRMIRVR